LLEYLPIVLINHILVYVVFLAFVASFYDAAITRFDERLLSPIFVSGLILFFTLIHGLTGAVLRNKVVYTVSVILFALFFINNMRRGIDFIIQKYKYGQSYNSKVLLNYFAP